MVSYAKEPVQQQESWHSLARLFPLWHWNVKKCLFLSKVRLWKRINGHIMKLITVLLTSKCEIVIVLEIYPNIYIAVTLAHLHIMKEWTVGHGGGLCCLDFFCNNSYRPHMWHFKFQSIKLCCVVFFLLNIRVVEKSSLCVHSLYSFPQLQCHNTISSIDKH